MRDLETRWPCPVCLASGMEKVVLAGPVPLVLDHCRRCGGVWFDSGEVEQLRRRAAKQLWDQVVKPLPVSVTPCHGCHAPLDRDAERCPACGRSNRIDCPSCHRELDRRRPRGVSLDHCGGCRGVWVDHAELASLWTLGIAAVGTAAATSSRSSLALDLISNVDPAPDLIYYGAKALGEAATHAPDLLAGAGELLFQAAGHVFEAVLTILAGLLEGLG